MMGWLLTRNVTQYDIHAKGIGFVEEVTNESAFAMRVNTS